MRQRILIVMAVAALLVGAGGCSTGSREGAGGSAVDADRALETEIYTRLADEPGGFPAGLTVNVSDGVATITGAASTPAARARAIAVVRSTPGVTQVVVLAPR